MIPEEVKADLKKKADGIDPKEFFDAYSNGGHIKYSFICDKPIIQTEIIIDPDFYGFAVNQNSLQIDYHLTRSMVYEILRS